MRARAIAPIGLATAPAITGLWALCAWEARRARAGDRPFDEALPGSGLVSHGLGTPPVRIVWLGDSLAAGLGCDHLDETPAHLTARLLERAVDVQMLAVPGARAVHVLEEQLPQLDRGSTDVVVVCVGANDVAAPTPRRQYAAQLDAILRELAPLPTIVLTLPDMAMPDRLLEPLRSLAGARARWFETARARVTGRHRHAVSVDIASRPAGLTRRAGRRLLCADRFHPGPEGYRVWAERIATVCHQVLESAPAPTLVD